MNAAAEALGLRPGMPVAQAQALVPGLAVMAADPRADAAALERLAIWAQRRFSPVVAPDPPDGLVMDVTGTDHLHGGEAAMLAALTRRLAAAGFSARAAVADTPGAAHAAARYLARDMLVVPPGAAEALLRPLPVAALRLPPDVADGLRQLGLERVQDLLERPRAALLLRFGPEPGRRLDQALGRAPEPVEPVRPPEVVTARRSFAEPVSAPQTIARHVERLAVALCERLAARELGARHVDLLAHRVDGARQTLRVGLARPDRDAARLFRLLQLKLERIDPGFGVETMELAASWVEPLPARQMAAPLAGEAQEDIAGLIDALASRVGEDRVRRFRPRQSDVPERSLAATPPLAPETGATWEGDWPRPPRLLPRPEPVETMALLPDHPPVWFSWRGVRRRVRRADGPERIRGEWWAREAEMTAVRDYFRVEDENGRRYWLFRCGDGERPESGDQRWFLHGIFA